jgi:hypothetical protein
MKRKLKVIGITAVAVFALAAVSASAASAATFHAESAPVIFEGEQTTTNEFTVTTGVVKCTGAVFTGTQTAATSATATLHPAYSGCKAFGLSATVTTTGCNYVFDVTGSATAPATTIECEAGKTIVVKPTGLACEVIVEAQSGLTGLTLANGGSGATRDITATANVGNIVYSEIGTGCKNGGTLHHTEGTYKGAVTVKGFKDSSGTKGAQEGIWTE